MKKLILASTMFYLSLIATYGQNPSDTSSHKQIAIVGFNTGSLFSWFSYNDTNYYRPPFAVSEDKYTPGFSAGVSVSFINSRHLSLQTEISYQLFRHEMRYYDAEEDYSYYRSFSADYSLTTSVIQVSALLKIKTGDKFQTYIGTGPFVNFPVYHAIKGDAREIWYNSLNEHYDSTYYDNDIKVNIKNAFGCFAACGLNIPYRNNNFGLEFRYYFCPGTLIDIPATKHNYFTINLTYQFKSGKNNW